MEHTFKNSFLHFRANTLYTHYPYNYVFKPASSCLSIQELHLKKFNGSNGGFNMHVSLV